jgi:hypothetical protein
MNALLEEQSLGDLEILEVYLQYNGPRLFSCFNQDNQLFLALWVDDENERDLWMYVPITEHNLKQVRSGHISLREAFREGETGSLYIAEVSFSGEVQRFESINPTEVEEEWLPLPNVRLNIHSEIAFSQSAKSIARTRKREILNVALKFLNQALHEVPAQKLGHFLSNLQSLMDAIGQAIGGIPTTLGSVPLCITTQTELSVIGTYDSSFGINLAAPGASDGELFATSLLAPEVMEKLLDLLSASKDEGELIISLRSLSFRAVSAYRKVLRSLISAESGLSVEWGSLIIGKGGLVELTYEQINRALAAASKVEVQEKRDIRIVGKLIEGNQQSGHFLFEKEEDEKKISGYAQNASILNKEVLGETYTGVFEEIIEVAPSGDIVATYRLFELIPTLESKKVDEEDAK